MTRKFTHVDLLLSIMVIVWGINFTVIKFSLRSMSPLTFNALRFLLGASFLMLVLRLKEGHLRLDRSDIVPVLLLGIVGNTIYQLLFIYGIYHTRASNTSLILAITPVFITLLSAYLKHERVSRLGWAGILLSFGGVFLILKESAQTSLLLGAKTLKGDLLLLAACVCWAIYSVFCVPLLRKYSALKVTAYTTMIGSGLFFLTSLSDLTHEHWRAIPWAAWGGLLYSLSGAFVCGYLIWYYGVQRIGNVRTSIYSNLVPLVALLVARIYLHERITFSQGLGAGVVILGIYLTRIKADVTVPPASET